MPSRLFATLLERQRTRRLAPGPGESEESADSRWIREYQAKRNRYGLISGAWTVPAAGVVRLIAPGIDRVVRMLTLQAGSSNNGVIYLAGNGQPTSTTSLGLTKSSPPLTLVDVLVGDLSATGTSANDVLTWLGSGTPRDAIDEEED